ncbi:MAG: hypothetical protein Tsb009_22180 [Planctomycetaceae bacterium]
MKYYFLALATAVVVCVGCAYDGQQILDKGEYSAPPAAMMQRPGPMVDGPGPGVMAMPAQPPMRAFSAKTTQVKFVGQKGMTIGWKIDGGFAENQLNAPGIYDFRQGATYRLKLTNIPDHEMLTLYPTLQVYPSHPTTDAYLSHNSIPIELTDEDFEQIESNNYVTKVIYLPDPKFQELAVAGVETLVSTRLDPGVDPVAAADRRGTILVVLRIGNKKLETTGKGGMGPDGAMLPGGVNQVSYRVLDGMQGQHAPPMPIGPAGGGFRGIPNPMIVGGMGRPGMPAMNPVAGMGGIPSWGMPMTATPIGLPGPAHLPLGGPAGLRSHTIVNNTKVDLGKPVDRMLIEVEHRPGYRLPKPVKHIRYTETHPTYGPGELAQPKFARP